MDRYRILALDVLVGLVSLIALATIDGRVHAEAYAPR
jgi:hypothetical protein